MSGGMAFGVAGAANEWDLDAAASGSGRAMLEAGEDRVGTFATALCRSSEVGKFKSYPALQALEVERLIDFYTLCRRCGGVQKNQRILCSFATIMTISDNTYPRASVKFKNQ